uniref:Uncharacterized protein n=1 Tax=Plectus sambesii TaxID=2011161 RepID=A0A914WAV4_9BILA
MERPIKSSISAAISAPKVHRIATFVSPVNRHHRSQMAESPQGTPETPAAPPRLINNRATKVQPTSPAEHLSGTSSWSDAEGLGWGGLSGKRQPAMTVAYRHVRAGSPDAPSPSSFDRIIKVRFSAASATTTAPAALTDRPTDSMKKRQSAGRGRPAN